MTLASRTPVRYAVIANMRTLSTQVRLRRLIRSFDEALNRLLSDPHERQMAASVVARLQELSTEVRSAWRRESLASPPGDPIDRYVSEAQRTIEFAIAGLQQAGADLELLRTDFEVAALPLEIFMRGLDVEPALQRSA
jgi:CelD/BcsL family acetyltransferase involved in cellulose biosynthesis